MERGEKFEWNAILQKAFDDSKARLENHALLAHPDPAAPLAIVTDASGDGIGGALEQWDDKKGIWQPLGFYSRHLSSAEKKWPAYNQELRAIQGSLRHFRDQIEGVNSLVIYTDHKPLTTSMTTEKPFVKTVHNMLLEIAEYTTDIRHKPGKANNVADTLSRPNGLDNPVANIVEEVIETALTTLDFEEIARAQTGDEELQRLLGQPDGKQAGMRLGRITQANRPDLIVDKSKTVQGGGDFLSVLTHAAQRK